MPKQLKLIHLVILFCLSVFVFSTHSIASQKDGLLKVYFLDIGQGDSIFVETPSGYQILVDGGPDNKVLSQLGRVMPFFDKDIDFVVSTHPDLDHVSGLVDVLTKYEVDNIVQFPIEHESSEYEAWKSGVDKEGAQKIIAEPGAMIDFGDGVTLAMLYPSKNAEFKKSNDASIISMLKYGETEILLTGDIESKVERKVVIDKINLDADILKVAHHGSKTSSIEEFLAAASPDVAIISVGVKNRYGHPAPEIISRFENFGIDYFRTDLNGTIKIISDGMNYRVLPSKI